jgi:hypothetical protein
MKAQTKVSAAKKAWITRRKNAIDADLTLSATQKRMKKAWVTIRARQEGVDV